MPTWTMLAKGLLGLDGEIVGLNGSGHSYGKRTNTGTEAPPLTRRSVLRE